MTNSQVKVKKFGTAPVFLTAISTILGAIMFLRFGYAVGNVSFLGAFLIILIGHMVTLPTAMAIAEIATNQKVQGGGEYYIISRSFGLIIGATIGASLYLSQAVSVAFYIIAFSEAFHPVFEWLGRDFGLIITDKRWVSIPAALILSALMTKKGADIGVKALYVIVATLFLSIALFFLGKTDYAAKADFMTLASTVAKPHDFFLVFAICFPAFTGMTAGVGLSGDLKNPQKSIPLGTLSATIAGMIVYIFIALKLALSAPPEALAADQLIMSKIALWSPIIPIGLACATLSSALGSFLVAPRTLQAIGGDDVLPWKGLGRWLAVGKGDMHEPVNASLVTSAIAFVFVLMGDVDFVAQIISMFFMVTYGAICLISFFEHLAADPSYRPTYRSRWYVSLFGAIMCLWLMFQMHPGYALMSLIFIFALYITLARCNEDKRGLSNMTRGAVFQISRLLQVFVQHSRKQDEDSWRPAVVCLSEDSFKRLAAFDLMRWISHRYGFGTYIHFMRGYLSRATRIESEKELQRLVHIANVSESNVFVDTLVSPSFRTAVAQAVQFPGISGKENNMLLFEFAKSEPEKLEAIIENYQLAIATGFDVCILASCDKGFGYRKELHVWLTPSDYENASMMILLAYVLLGHKDWSNASIRIFSLVQEANVDDEANSLFKLIKTGRLPISHRNTEPIPWDGTIDKRAVITERSSDAGLVILGFRGEALKGLKGELFTGYDGIGNILFVNTRQDIELIKEPEALPAAEPEKAEEETTDESAETPAPPANEEEQIAEEAVETEKDES